MKLPVAFLLRVGSVVALLAATATHAFSAVSVVDANSSAPGDSFTNATTSTTGQAVGASGWYYNNVRNNGFVGVNTDYPNSGNGSASFAITQGPGGASSKADLEFLPSATQDVNGNWSPGASLGSLGDLTSLSYDWYRDSSSTASQWLAPVLRLEVYDPVTGANGYLVYELEVNQAVSGAAAPTNTWITENVFANNDKLWASGSTLPGNLNGTNGPAQYYDATTLAGWESNYANYQVVGVSVGVGSGWGTFNGAVDNVTFGFNGASTTYNFEVAAAAVPEPTTFVVWSMFCALILFNRQRRRN